MCRVNILRWVVVDKDMLYTLGDPLLFASALAFLFWICAIQVILELQPFI